MLPQMPPSVMNNRNNSVPRVSQRIVAFSVHMKCDGTSPNLFVVANKQSVDRGLRPPTNISDVQNVRNDNIQLMLNYAAELEEDELTHRIDQDTILGAWVTLEGEPQVHNARFTLDASLSSLSATIYDIALEDSRNPGTYDLFKPRVTDKVYTLTIVFHQ